MRARILEHRNLRQKCRWKNVSLQHYFPQKHNFNPNSFSVSPKSPKPSNILMASVPSSSPSMKATTSSSLPKNSFDFHPLATAAPVPSRNPKKLEDLFVQLNSGKLSAHQNHRHLNEISFFNSPHIFLLNIFRFYFFFFNYYFFPCVKS